MLLLRQIDDKPGKKFAINDSINLMDCPAVPANQEYQEYFLCLKVFTHTQRAAWTGLIRMSWGQTNLHVMWDQRHTSHLPDKKTWDGQTKSHTTIKLIKMIRLEYHMREDYTLRNRAFKTHGIDSKTSSYNGSKSSVKKVQRASKNVMEGHWISWKFRSYLNTRCKGKTYWYGQALMFNGNCF